MPVPLLAPAPPAPMGSPVTHDATIVTTRKLAQARVMGVPPEEFGIERGARSIRDCNYCFHEVREQARTIATMPATTQASAKRSCPATFAR